MHLRFRLSVVASFSRMSIFFAMCVAVLNVDLHDLKFWVIKDILMFPDVARKLSIVLAASWPRLGYILAWLSRHSFILAAIHGYRVLVTALFVRPGDSICFASFVGLRYAESSVISLRGVRSWRSCAWRSYCEAFLAFGLRDDCSRHWQVFGVCVILASSLQINGLRTGK